MGRTTLSFHRRRADAAGPAQPLRREGLKGAIGLLILGSMGSTLAVTASELLPVLKAWRSDQGVLVNFETRFDLPPAVFEALQKGVALHFQATAGLVRSRWYWRDKRYTEAVRTWRLSYQPLTQSYRVSLGGLSQTYRTLAEALRAVQTSAQWRIAEALPSDDDGEFRVEFSYRLDTDQLPRPLQIGIGNQPDWNLRLERTVPVGAEPR